MSAHISIGSIALSSMLGAGIAGVTVGYTEHVVAVSKTLRIGVMQIIDNRFAQVAATTVMLNQPVAAPCRYKKRDFAPNKPWFTAFYPTSREQAQEQAQQGSAMPLRRTIKTSAADHARNKRKRFLQALQEG